MVTGKRVSFGMICLRMVGLQLKFWKVEVFRKIGNYGGLIRDGKNSYKIYKLQGARIHMHIRGGTIH